MLCCMLNLSVKQQLCLDRWLFGWSTFFVVVVVVVARNVFLWPAPALPTKSEPNGVGRNYLTIACLGIYICGTVHRNSRLKKANEMQQYADIYLLLNYSTCFGRSSRPSSGVHKTVFAATGTDHTIWGTGFFKRLKKLAPQIVWSVPEAATTVLCTPDDVGDGRPKHVE